MTKQITGAIEAAEKELGFHSPDSVVVEVLEYSCQKLTSIQKPVEYLPVLLHTELMDFYTRLEINMKGLVNHVQRMLANPLSSSVS